MSTPRDNRKCDILRVGTFDEEGKPVGWEFDGTGSRAHGMEFRIDGSVLYGGWTLDQLRQIAEDEYA